MALSKKLEKNPEEEIELKPEYQTIYEQIINWFFVTWGPLFIFQLNQLYMMIYIISSAGLTVIGHSNYLLPFFENEIIRHSKHHKYFNCNYGLESYDKLIGTNR